MREGISRRNFIKFATFSFLGTAVHPFVLDKTSFSNTEYYQFENEEDFSPPPYELVANIFDEVKNSFGNVPYDMTRGHHCSATTGRYMSELGYPMYRFIIPSNNQNINLSPSYSLTQRFPDANTVAQMQSFITLNNSLNTNMVVEYPVHEAAALDWTRITPGSFLYFRVQGQTHNGVDTFQHVAIFIGINEAGNPEFGDFAFSMENGPQRNRSFEEVARGVYGRNTYQREINQNLNISITQSRNTITIVDTHQLLWTWQQTIEYKRTFLHENNQSNS
jgi:hypothetical protein